MGFLKRALGFEPTPIKLLSASIVTDEDHRYFVAFDKHHPQLQLPEFVRLILHYYAKLLFNFDPSDPGMSQSAFILKNMVHSVIAKGISKDSNIFQIADIDDAATMVSSSPSNVPRKIVATLLFVSTTERQINTPRWFTPNGHGGTGGSLLRHYGGYDSLRIRSRQKNRRLKRRKAAELDSASVFRQDGRSF